jgi:hypothetical protein
MVGDIHIALTALEWIEGQADWIRGYLESEYATFPNVINKTKIRTHDIKEMAELIIECMENIEKIQEEYRNKNK